MTIVIDQAFLDHTAKTAVEQAIKSAVVNSPNIQTAVSDAMKRAMVDVAPIIAATLEQAVKEVTSKPEFLHGLIRKAILDSSDKIKGSFDASLRAAGKRLALDPETVEKVIEGIKIKAALEAEEHRAEMELKGGGAFA